MDEFVIDDIRNRLEDYARWLRDRTVPSEARDGWITITTPCLDRHNDCLQFCVRRDGDGYLLTDGGSIFDDLVGSGVPMDSPPCQDLLASTVAGFGVRLDGEFLVLRATREDFPQKAHHFIQAMLIVDDRLFHACTQGTVDPLAEDIR